MKANEIRVGNLFDNEGQTVHAMDILTSGHDQPRVAFGYFVDSIGFERFLHHENCPKPIPLTPEWLEKFGFKPELDFDHSNDYWYHEKMRTGAKAKFYIYLPYGVFDGMAPCSHVHQLQNLYFALTGTELTIKP